MEERKNDLHWRQADALDSSATLSNVSRHGDGHAEHGYQHVAREFVS